jgi:hypothetical protein
MRPKKGIYLLNNNLLGGSMLNIGNSNNFSNIFTGIYSDNSDVNIFNNTFHSINFPSGISVNMLFPTEFSAGILATNLQNTNITNNVKIESNIVNNCRNGIHVSRNIDPTILYNTLTNNPNGVAINVTFLKYSNIAEIKYNNISHYGTGILASRNDKALINIRLNQISWSQFDASSPRTGIRIAGSLFPQEKYLIYHNTIINPNFGINILRLRKPFIKYNTIQNIISSGLVSNIPTGILVTNCRDACIKSNKVSGNTSSPQYVSNIGIHFHTSNNTKVLDDTLSNLGSCIRATYLCPNSSVNRNSFISSYEGISLAVSGYIGPQNGIFSPSDNMWKPNLNHWALPRRVHYSYGSPGEASPLYVNANNGQNTTGVWEDPNLAEGGGHAFKVIPTTGLSTINCGNYVLSPETQISIDEAKKLIDELVNFPEYEEETRENVKRQLVALLSDDSLALTDPEILAFWLEVQSEPLGISNEVQLLTELGEYLAAGILNLSIETLTVMEEVERAARNLQLKIFITDTMTSEDIQQLEEIAFLCPYTHGEGVYIARSLLSVIDPLFEYVNECELDPSFEVRSAQIQQNKTALKIYPNPVQDVLNFELLNLDSDQPVLIQVSDISGRIVLSTSVKVEGSNSIHVGKLESGCYLIKVNTDTVGSFSEKFCIIR